MFNHFTQPWLLLLFVPLCVALWRVFRRVRVSGIVFSDATARFSEGRRSLRMWMTLLAPIAFFLGLSALILAAAGPALLQEEEPIVENREAIEKNALAIMLVADVSGSMDALDFSPKTLDRTRLDVVKKTFIDFIDRSPNDYIGVVTFGGFARVQSPLTSDHQTLKRIVERIEIPGTNEDIDPMVSRDEQMTAIGDGLAMGITRIKDAVPENKVIILLSDGVHNAGALSPEKSAAIATALGVKVYTIGVGSTGKTLVRARNIFTGRMELQETYGELDEKTLHAVAEKTGAHYTNVRSTMELEATFKKIESLERTKMEEGETIRIAPIARPWSLLGCLIGIGLTLIFVAIISLVALLRRPI